MATITLLSENRVRTAGLLAEHGLAYWIDTGGARVLFDTGQGMVFEHNARKLGIDPASADAIVLSHGHYDHVLGLRQALAAAPRATLWMHPDARKPKFSRSPDGSARRISVRQVEDGDFGAGRDVRLIESPCEVVPGVWATGEIPRVHAWEDVGGPFFLDENLRTPDPLRDDIALFLPGREACTIVLGCAHAGVVNTLDHVAALTRGLPVHTLLGGMHLLAASDARMDNTIAALHRFAPRRLAPCHCTGFNATLRLANAFPESFAEACVGTTFTTPNQPPPNETTPPQPPHFLGLALEAGVGKSALG